MANGWPKNLENMMKKVLGSLFFATLALGVQAGTKTVEASGTVWHNPEFATVTVEVKSECYPTANAAYEANTKAAIMAKKSLEALIPNPGQFDNVTATAGMTTKFSRRDYVDGHEQVTCKNTWQQTTTITFKTGNLNAFSGTFARLQTDTLNVLTGLDSSNIEEPKTYAEIGSPNFDICPATREKMTNEATVLAHENAIKEFESIRQCCGIHGDVEIEEIGQPEASYSPKSALYAASSLEIGETLEIDISPISVTERVMMKFRFQTTFLRCDK